MNIAVFSDTHGNCEDMRSAIVDKGPFDMLFHLGDGIDDGQIIAEEFSLPFHGVYGNEDYPYFNTMPERLCVKVYSWNFLLSHGHQLDINPYHAKDKWEKNLKEMARLAKLKKADVFLFGHTHAALIEKLNGVVICNPGDQYISPNSMPTFAIISAAQHRLEIKILKKTRHDGWEKFLEFEFKKYSFG